MAVNRYSETLPSRPTAAFDADLQGLWHDNPILVPLVDIASERT